MMYRSLVIIVIIITIIVKLKLNPECTYYKQVGDWLLYLIYDDEILLISYHVIYT